jgi:hypothetical protein
MSLTRRSEPADAPISSASAAELERLVREDPSAWRALAFAAYARLKGELERLGARPDTPGAAKCAYEALDEALRAMARAPRRGLRSRHPWLELKLFYSGTRIEQSWRSIHRAQAYVYLLYAEPELKIQAEHLEELVAELPDQSALVKSVTTLISQMGQSATSGVVRPPGASAKLQELYEQAMNVSDNLQLEARALRNALMTASASILVVFVVLGLAHLLDGGIVSLCASASHRTVCPLGRSAHPLDVFVVGLAGMLGGLLSVVIPLATGERIKTPYRIFNQQLVLKTLAGAVSAVGGLILVEGGLIAAIKLESTAAILGYAIVFGFAQQLVTGAVDRRANSLAKQTPAAKSA